MWNAAHGVRARRACRAGFAGLALVVLSASLAEAEYGPRTKIGNNYQQTSTTTSLNGTDQGISCDGFATCYVWFQQAPQQRPLIVQHVACVLAPNAGDLRYARLRSRKGQTLLLREIPLVPVPTSGVSVMNSPVMHLLKPGERAVIQFFNSVAANWGTPHCNISGQLKQP